MTTFKKSGGFNFVYKPRDERASKEYAQQKGGTKDRPFKSGFDVYFAKPGDNVLRILPPTWEPQNHYGYIVWLHKFVGLDNGTYLCPNKMQRKPCAVCKAHREALAANDKEEAEQHKPKQHVICWVLDREGEVKTPQLYAMGWQLDDQIVELAKGRHGKLLMLDHPDVGHDVIIRRTGQGKTGTRYIPQIDIDASPISKDPKEQQRILEFISENPVPDTLLFHDSAYLDKIMVGDVEEKDTDLDEPETTPPWEDNDDDAPKQEAEKPKRKLVDDDDDDDDDSGEDVLGEEDDEDIEEEVITRKPVRGKRK